MTQTPITKAIEQLKGLINMYEGMDNAVTCFKDAIQILTDLLPYEREVIEGAYNQGDYDCGRGEFGGIPEFRNKSDYFTKTFTNNAD